MNLLQSDIELSHNILIGLCEIDQVNYAKISKFITDLMIKANDLNQSDFKKLWMEQITSTTFSDPELIALGGIFVSLAALDMAQKRLNAERKKKILEQKPNMN